MKAILKNYRQSPRKTRLVGDAIVGKRAVDAIDQLRFMPKRAANPVLKLLESALVNALNTTGADKNDLIVKSVRVDKGIVLKRMMPRARGSAYRINKRTSHVAIELGLKETSVKASKSAKKVAVAPKKVAKKKVTTKKA
ncbi:MAG: 50S ribosomal protein L22 [Candidatus Pacebacteria bacterium]|nr:50S ribosomal protein L22 [Candidatus Paceibacterota bacterium]MBP9780837.1 50S ribosomal protein L22 [Candidatus Paceibacterota bacterium]MDQ5949863.1 large subunit ribosomal protein [Patescibacteria group bacterium]MDQ5962074.1 large subunit ribosomal protein [Patescibacteria group bacterium]